MFCVFVGVGWLVGWFVCLNPVSCLIPTAIPGSCDSLHSVLSILLLIKPSLKYFKHYALSVLSEADIISHYLAGDSGELQYFLKIHFPLKNHQCDW